MPALELEGWQDEVLHEVAQTLSQLGCSHGKGEAQFGATPPMMYREWIICVVAHAVQQERERLSTLRSLA